MKTIVGAGLAGLIAAHAWPQARIVEVAPQPRPTHRALLRFRGQEVARLTGIDFRKVRVHKGIWSDGDFVAPNIRLANLYSQKVLRGGLRGDRSIWNIEPVDRYVAPDNLYEQLVDAVGRRIEWNTPATFKDGPTVSTAPLPVAMATLGMYAEGLEFRRAAIEVRRWRLPRADAFQTVYFPDDTTALYRASITGNILIAEFVDTPNYAAEEEDNDVSLLSKAFGIDLFEAEPLEAVRQQYGKIEPIPDAARKQLLFRLTHDHDVYSLGRFATWRNILLDDVVDDIAAIKRLHRIGAAYDLHAAAGR